MRPEIEYKREMNRNYIVMRAEEDENERYTIKMLSENRIDGVLPFHEKYIDGQRWYYYDITSRQPLNRILEARCISGEEVRRLVSGILFSVRQAERFLLDESQISFEPRLIYVEPDSLKSGLCLIPGMKMDFSGGFYALSQYLLEHVDHNDSEAVVLAFGIMKESGKENFGVEDIERCIGKTMENGENVKRQGTTETETKDQGLVGGREADGQKKTDGCADMGRKEKNLPEISGSDRKNHRNDVKFAWFPAVLMVLLPAALYLRMGMFVFLRYKWLLLAAELVLGTATFVLYDMGKGQEGPAKEEKTLARQTSEDWEVIFREEDNIGEVMPQGTSWDPSKREPVKANPLLENQEDEIQTVLLTTQVPSEGSCKLVPTQGGAEIEVGYFPFLIGKSRELTDYCLDRPEVSRLHVRIDETEAGCTVTDLNSTNGTRVGGHLLEANETYPLPPGSVLEIAAIPFRFVAESVDGNQTAF